MLAMQTQRRKCGGTASKQTATIAKASSHPVPSGITTASSQQQPRRRCHCRRRHRCRHADAVGDTVGDTVGAVPAAQRDRSLCRVSDGSLTAGAAKESLVPFVFRYVGSMRSMFGSLTGAAQAGMSDSVAGGQGSHAAQRQREPLSTAGGTHHARNTHTGCGTLGCLCSRCGSPSAPPSC